MALDYIPEVKLIFTCCPVCGCGSPGLSYELIRKWLHYIKTWHEIYEKHNPGFDTQKYQAYKDELLSDPDCEFIDKAIHSETDIEGAIAIINEILDYNKCTEHGMSWHTSWLTKRGEKLLKALELARMFDYDFSIDAGWAWREKKVRKTKK